MKSKAFLLALSILTMFLTMEAQSQTHPQPFPHPQVTDPPQDWLWIILNNNKFRIGGIEGGAATYGYSVGLPVFWVQDQVKIVPMAGWFWNAPAGWSGNDSVGGKLLYYFQQQRRLAPGEANFYAGLSTFSTSGSWNRNGEYQTGVAVGVEPFYNRYWKLGLELQLGLRSTETSDTVYGGIGVIVGFGW